MISIGKFNCIYTFIALLDGKCINTFNENYCPREYCSYKKKSDSLILLNYDFNSVKKIPSI